MIVSGVHLGDKKTAHVLLSYQTQQQLQNTPSRIPANTSFHKSPPPPPTTSFPANPGRPEELLTER